MINYICSIPDTIGFFMVGFFTAIDVFLSGIIVFTFVKERIKKGESE